MNLPFAGLLARITHALTITAALLLPLAGALASPPAPQGPIPIAHWRFEEGSGTVTRDTAGLHPGTLLNGASFTNAGIAGSGLALRADVGGAVVFGDILPLTNTAFSISAWFKTPPGDTTPEAVVFAKHRPWSDNGYFVLLNSGTGTITAYGGNNAVAHANTPVNDGEWHHVVLVIPGNGEVRLHIDGGPPKATGSGGTVSLSPADFMIGGMDPPPPARRFNGVIDEVQVYDSAIDQPAIDFLRANPGLHLAQRDILGFEPAAGPVVSPARISIFTTNTLGQIRYTTDGSEPLITSTPYTSPFNLQVTAPVTVRARVFFNGFPVSEIRSVTYSPDLGIRILPAENLFTNQVTVTLTTRFNEVILRYTTDGSEPLPGSTAYNGPFNLTQSATIQARAFLNGFPVTEVVSRTYTRYYVFDDAIPAAWRERFFGPGFSTDPRALGDADPDGDGSTNIQEFLAQTDPLDPTSGLRVHVRAVPELRFATIPGRTYRILRATRVDDPNPAVIAEFTATGSEHLHVDQAAGRDFNPAFYLIEHQP
jgi:hypothetical protein